MEYLADLEPAMEEDLLAAAGCFETEHDLMWQIWGKTGGNGRSDDNVRKLADPAIRGAIAPMILQARDEELQAADHIQRALSSELS
jgi:hypothetical protein